MYLKKKQKKRQMHKFAVAYITAASRTQFLLVIQIQNGKKKFCAWEKSYGI
jgi:ribosomal protein L20